MALAIGASRTAAAGPALVDYLRACGIGDEAFARFADDRQIADVELEVVRRIAVRLRDCPADVLGRMATGMLPAGGDGTAADAGHAASTRLPQPAEAKMQRARTFEIEGSLASVEPVKDGDETLWRCGLTLTGSPRQAVVYAAEVSAALRTAGIGQRVAASGVFVKYVPAVESTAVFVSPRLGWRPDSPLANWGMDYAMLEGIQDDSALSATDHGAFYRMLQLAKRADPARLNHEAVLWDASEQGVPALFRDPAGQRGRLVRISGAARRVVRVPIDDPAAVSRLGKDHYYEIDLVAEGSQNHPLVFCARSARGNADRGTAVLR